MTDIPNCVLCGKIAEHRYVDDGMGDKKLQVFVCPFENARFPVCLPCRDSDDFNEKIVSYGRKVLNI